jgi:hypothetical protein
MLQRPLVELSRERRDLIGPHDDAITFSKMNLDLGKTRAQFAEKFGGIIGREFHENARCSRRLVSRANEAFVEWFHIEKISRRRDPLTLEADRRKWKIPGQEGAKTRSTKGDSLSGL